MNILFWQSHPFPVDARLERSCTLAWAVPADELAARLPRCLSPDVFQEKWGFVAVAIVQTCGLRPSHFPRWAGQDFMLGGYRYFVRYRTPEGRMLRGLCIIRSETDKRRMAWLGNLFTGYGYVKTKLCCRQEDNILVVSDATTGLRIELEESAHEPPLPETSPFTDWREARRFSGPLPFTFSANPSRLRVVIVEGVRSHWQPRPLRVIRASVPFLGTLGFSEMRLANAFVVKEVPYHWKAGRIELWNPQ